MRAETLTVSPTSHLSHLTDSTSKLYPGGEFEEREVVVVGVLLILGVPHYPGHSQLLTSQGAVLPQVDGELGRTEVRRGAVGGCEEPLIT